MTIENIFLELFEQNSGKLWRFVLTFIKNREDAKDIYSETIAIAFENFGKLRDDKAFLAYLFTI